MGGDGDGDGDDGHPPRNPHQPATDSQTLSILANFQTSYNNTFVFVVRCYCVYGKALIHDYAAYI